MQEGGAGRGQKTEIEREIGAGGGAGTGPGLSDFRQRGAGICHLHLPLGQPGLHAGLPPCRTAAADDAGALAGMVDGSGAGTGKGAAPQHRCRWRPAGRERRREGRARKLQGSKPTPVCANRVGEVLRKMFTYAQSWAGVRTIRHRDYAAGSRTHASGSCHWGTNNRGRK